jgi:hypothetical protein
LYKEQKSKGKSYQRNTAFEAMSMSLRNGFVVKVKDQEQYLGK